MDKQDPILPEQFDEVERYVLYQMSPEEKQAFEERLSSENVLKTAVEEMQMILLGVREATLADKLDSFHEFSEERQQPFGVDSGARIVSVRKWLLAACVIGILLVGAWFALLNKSETESLFVAYFKPDPGLVTAMSGTEHYAFDRAMVDYKTGNYDAAIEAWTKLQVAQPSNDTLNYFLGASQLAANDANKAIAYLQKVTAIPTSAFFYDANWYLGLSYLKEKNKKEAIASILKSNHPLKHALLTKLAK